MMTIKPSDIFFTHTSVWLLIILLAVFCAWFIWRFRTKFSSAVLGAIAAFVGVICLTLYTYVLPASKEVEYLYKELQKTNQLSFVLNRVIPGTDMNQELEMLSQNLVPNNKFGLIPNNHMKILRREFGTPEYPVQMASPKQLETYLKMVDLCFEGALREDLFDQVKELPVNAKELQRHLDNSYAKFLAQNERKPHHDSQCHRQLMDGSAIPQS